MALYRRDTEMGSGDAVVTVPAVSGKGGTPSPRSVRMWNCAEPDSISTSAARAGFLGAVVELPEGPVQMYVRDPAGNLVELICRDAGEVDRDHPGVPLADTVREGPRGGGRPFLPASAVRRSSRRAAPRALSLRELGASQH